LLVEFEEWMFDHRGVTSSTLVGYRHYISDVISASNGKSELLTAKKIRTLIAKRAKDCRLSTTRFRINAIRMFVKFLVANGYCRFDLSDAIPSVAQWKLSSLPKYIQPGEIELVIACSGYSTALEKRNRAIILLLARLGMRAGEIAGLQLSDIDWENGLLTVLGKNRHEARLPMPQDVGDALYDYISSARPVVNNDSVFITANAPLSPITRYAVKHVAAKTIKKAGIKTPSFGAHVLRHSVATALLRQGSSLHLRH
jgi:integrase/recombinase XerD